MYCVTTTESHIMLMCCARTLRMHVLRARGSKCLQDSAVRFLRGQQRRRVALRLAQECNNDDGSGCSGTRREYRNFRAVEDALRREGVFLWVYESTSVSALRAGDGLRGRLCIFEYILSLSTAVVQICRFIPLVNPINYSTKHFLIDFIVNGTFCIQTLCFVRD